MYILGFVMGMLEDISHEENGCVDDSARKHAILNNVGG